MTTDAECEDGPRVALIGCAKLKAPGPCAAELLYRSDLFRSSVAWARAHTDRFLILSAKYHVLEPATVVDPYDLALRDLSAAARATWGRVAGEMIERLVPEPNATLICLAGALYADALDFARDIYFEEPLAGRSVGQRLHWLKADAQRAP